MKPSLKMKELYPTMISGDGIMSDLSDFSVPWHDLEDTSLLDIGYYWHSANKLASPIVMDIFDELPLTEAKRTTIAGVVYQIYDRKWAKLWDVYTAEYNPISNYDMTETETIDKQISKEGSNTGTLNTANTGTINDSTSDSGTVSTARNDTKTNTGTQTTNVTDSNEDGIYGFNSSESVGSSTSDGSSTNTRTDNLSTNDTGNELETRDLTLTDAKTINTNELETHNLANTEDVEDDTQRTLSRSGNIGVTTSQQMIESEIELWKWNFYKQVFEDIDSILCLDVY